MTIYAQWRAAREGRLRLQRILDRVALQVDLRTWRERRAAATARADQVSPEESI